MKKNIAVVGCGRISGHHCRSIRQVGIFNLKAVCDLDLEKAKVYGLEFNIPYYSSYRTMLKDLPDIDIIAVITPSGMHYEHAIEFIEKYKKSVIVEKPTFLKVTHLLNCYEKAESLGLHVFPVFQNRYNLAVQKVKDSLNNNELGSVRIASVRVRWCRTNSYYSLAPWRGTYSMDGGALTNQGIHHIDLLRYLVGDISFVSAQTNTFGSNIEVEDSIVAHVTFKSGALGTIEITTAARPDNYEASLSLVCENGLAQIGGIAVNELQIFTPDPSICKNYSEDFSGNVYGQGHVKMYEDIAKVYLKDKPFPISLTDNLETIKLLHAIYVSAENKGKIINVDESLESSYLGAENKILADLYRVHKLEERQLC